MAENHLTSLFTVSETTVLGEEVWMELCCRLWTLPCAVSGSTHRRTIYLKGFISSSATARYPYLENWNGWTLWSLNNRPTVQDFQRGLCVQYIQKNRALIQQHYLHRWVTFRELGHKVLVKSATLAPCCKNLWSLKKYLISLKNKSLCLEVSPSPCRSNSN